MVAWGFRHAGSADVSHKRSMSKWHNDYGGTRSQHRPQALADMVCHRLAFQNGVMSRARPTE